jgi:hypothetical protein
MFQEQRIPFVPPASGILPYAPARDEALTRLVQKVPGLVALWNPQDKYITQGDTVAGYRYRDAWGGLVARPTVFGSARPAPVTIGTKGQPALGVAGPGFDTGRDQAGVLLLGDRPMIGPNGYVLIFQTRIPAATDGNGAAVTNQGLLLASTDTTTPFFVSTDTSGRMNVGNQGAYEFRPGDVRGRTMLIAIRHSITRNVLEMYWNLDASPAGIKASPAPYLGAGFLAMGGTIAASGAVQDRGWGNAFGMIASILGEVSDEAFKAVREEMFSRL